LVESDWVEEVILGAELRVKKEKERKREREREDGKRPEPSCRCAIYIDDSRSI